jgi:glycerol-3-phosphate O-acyltransferase
VKRSAAPQSGRLALVGAAIVGWVLLRRLLLPGARWYFRRRSKGVARAANRRLRLRIASFKMTRRRALVERLMRDPAVYGAIEEHSREEGVPEVVAAVRAERYAREIVPTFNAYLYFRVGIPLARYLTRSLYEVRGGGVEWERSAAVDEDAIVVFVMNHRSNMDYVVLAHLTSDRAALSYAAGEWARFWPLGSLVRSMGAFFVRRGSGDALYRRVLERFVQMAVEGGLTQVVFPEGGLSRDGALREPKIGLLDYMLRRFDPAGGRDLIFVPVAINYDWVLEDESLLELGGVPGGPSRGRSVASTARSVIRKMPLAVRGRRLARAALNFGTPISAREYTRDRNVDFRTLAREERVEWVRVLARTLMLNIGEIMPVVPVPVIAQIFVRDPGEVLSGPEVTARVRVLASELQERGSPVKGSDLEAALRLLTVRRLLVVDDGLYRAAPGSGKILRYYANAISHLFEPEGKIP